MYIVVTKKWGQWFYSCETYKVVPRRKRTIIQIYVYNIIVCIQYLYVLTRFTVVFSDEEKMTSSTFDFSDISTEEPDLVEKHSDQDSFIYGASERYEILVYVLTVLMGLLFMVSNFSYSRNGKC